MKSLIVLIFYNLNFSTDYWVILSAMKLVLTMYPSISNRNCHLLPGGIDYNSINQSLVFGPDLPTQQCINISTIADSLAEHTELFEVMATMNGSNIEASPVLAHIISSDGESSNLFSTLSQFPEVFFCLLQNGT